MAKGLISKGEVGRVQDALADDGIDARVRHVEGGSGFDVSTERLSNKQRALVQRRLQELGIGGRHSSESEND
ncbi:MAG TPA: hypothetical protein PKV72_07035 [Candidatus Peribacteria bacterium]|nr:hypothetical protein [Candidatus Peribacteria bacterium]